MATDFTVTVPAGTRSVTGGELEDDIVSRFSTPTPSVQSFGPTGPGQPLTPVFVATFDQLVDPRKMIGPQ